MVLLQVVRLNYKVDVTKLWSPESVRANAESHFVDHDPTLAADMISQEMRDASGVRFGLKSLDEMRKDDAGYYWRDADGESFEALLPIIEQMANDSDYNPEVDLIVIPSTGTGPSAQKKRVLEAQAFS